ncbi:MAG: hypothetical protein IJM79_04175 [Erysipelotrichaceae bacterium]|nr:hypothetical protein [Erysipelotrichaceae bacterium]
MLADRGLVVGRLVIGGLVAGYRIAEAKIITSGYSVNIMLSFFPVQYHLPLCFLSSGA